jgi:Methyltransferase domain
MLTGYFYLRFPKNEGPWVTGTSFLIWDLFPASFTCPWDIERVGIMGDGGKWICGMSKYVAEGERSHGRQINILSFGVADESTFETELLERIPTAKVWAWDFSVTKVSDSIAYKMNVKTIADNFVVWTST